MTGKSPWSDEVQRGVVESIMANIKFTYNPNTPNPSGKTVQRWVDKWEPILLKEIADRQHRQNQTTSRQHKPKTPKVRQDEKSYFRVPIVFLSDYKECLHTHLSAYAKSEYGAAVRRRERIQKELERIKKEVDK